MNRLSRTQNYLLTHTLRSGFCLRSKLLRGNIYKPLSVGKRRVRAPTVLHGDPSTVGEALAVIRLILSWALRAWSS